VFGTERPFYTSFYSHHRHNEPAKCFAAPNSLILVKLTGLCLMVLCLQSEASWSSR